MHNLHACITVGKGSLIGSITNVNRDALQYLFVVGNPGKVVKAMRDTKCPLELTEKPYDELII